MMPFRLHAIRREAPVGRAGSVCCALRLVAGCVLLLVAVSLLAQVPAGHSQERGGTGGDAETLAVDGPAVELLALFDGAEAPSVADVVPALRSLLAPEARAARAERVLARQRQRLVAYLLRVEDTPREIAVALAEYPHDELRLRRYAQSDEIRPPFRVLTDRGGHELELALTVALLYESIGLQVRLGARQADGGDRWTVRLTAERDRLERVLLEPADPAEVADARLLVARLASLEAPVTVIFDEQEPAGVREIALSDVTRMLLERRLTVLDRQLRASSDEAEAPPDAQLVEQLVAVQQVIAHLEPNVQQWVALIELLELWLATLQDQGDPRLGRAERAISAVERLAIEAGGGEEPGLIYRAARRSLEQGRTDEAAARLRTLVEQHPDFAPAGRSHPLVLLGRIAADQGNNEQALAYFSDAHQAGHGTPQDWAVGAALAYALGGEHNDESALRLYAAAERRGYAELEMYLRRGKIYHKAAQQQGTSPAEARVFRLHAQANFRAARHLDPSSRDAHLWWINSLMSRPKDTAPADVEPPQVEALLEAINEAQRRFPEWSLLFKLKAYIYRDWQHNPQQARAKLRQYIEEMEPGDTQATAALAELRE